MSLVVADHLIERVVVIKGGWSAEQHFSGFFAAVPALRELGLDVLVLDLRDPRLAERLQNLAPRGVVVVPLTLGVYGEDGCIQGLLELLGLPYVGSGVLPSALGMCKPLCKDLLRSWGINVADGLLWHREEPIPEYWSVVQQLGSPLVVKPPSGGASVDLFIASDEQAFYQQFRQAASRYDDLLIEQFLESSPCPGDEQAYEGRREYVVALLQDDQRTLVLPVGEVQLAGRLHDLESKSHAEYVFPARLADKVQARMQETALTIYQRLGCTGPLRVDMLLGADGLDYVHEINTLPGMTRDSAFALACAAGGLSHEDMWTWTVKSAFHRRPLHVPKLAPEDAPVLPPSLLERLSLEERLTFESLARFYPRLSPVPRRVRLYPVPNASAAAPSSRTVFLAG